MYPGSEVSDRRGESRLGCIQQVTEACALLPGERLFYQGNSKSTWLHPGDHGNVCTFRRGTVVDDRKLLAFTPCILATTSLLKEVRVDKAASSRSRKLSGGAAVRDGKLLAVTLCTLTATSPLEEVRVDSIASNKS